jgi:hypothetical protein
MMGISTTMSTNPRTSEALAGLGFARDALGRWSCPDLGRDIEGWFRLFQAVESLESERYAEYRRSGDGQARSKEYEAWAEMSYVRLEVERKMDEILGGRVHVLPDGRFLVPMRRNGVFDRVKVIERYE